MNPSLNHACVIGIDVGTSGVRAMAMRQDNRVLGAGARCSFDELDGDPRSPSLWWQAVDTAMQAILRQIGSAQVLAISVDGTSGTVLPVDSSGAALAAPMMYNDAVTDQAILQAIVQSMPATSAAGGVTSGLAKALVFASLKPWRIIHQADWIMGQLAEDFSRSDANNALKTGYDAVRGEWPEWLVEAGMDRSLLPEVFAPGTPVSSLCARLANHWGLSTSVCIVAGTTDGCASFLATGASEPGDAVTALGSTLTLKMLSDKPIYAPEYGVYSHLVGTSWLAGGASNSGGKVLDALFTRQQLESLSQAIDSAVPSGLDYYPLLQAGERFPVCDPAFTGKMQPRPASDVHFLQGLLEGISAIEALGYQRLHDNGAPALKSVRSVGGGASNPVWSALRQQKLGVPFLPAESLEAAAGTARLAVTGAITAGLW